MFLQNIKNEPMADEIDTKDHLCPLEVVVKVSLIMYENNRNFSFHTAFFI